MATINDLLYNYQETNEFVCSDGRMSVNGICPTDQLDSVQASQITEEIIDSSKDNKDNEYLKKIKEDAESKKQREKILTSLEGESDYFPDLGKEKFQWDFDKENKIDSYKNTINNNINAYNNWIETNVGISADVQTGLRVGGSAVALAGGSGVLAVIAPWAIPVLAGGAINRAERERIEKITDQDKQGDIQTVDMMTYNIPGANDPGFNIHYDDKDRANETPTGPTNQMEKDYGYGSDAGWY
tara:strand:+ start:504 stop:1229 length:726 start_codon:yes stop_codon:yes gene_type:complete